MKQAIHSDSKSKSLKLLKKMKRELRQNVLNEIKTKGMEQKLFNEYHELAGVTRELLSILNKNNLTSMLNDQQKREYDQLMLKLSKCGVRCQILVEESASREYEAFLQKLPAESKYLN